MRVMIWPAGDDNDAVSQYRLLMPARALIAQGADVVIDTTGPQLLRVRGEGPPALDPIVGLAEPPDADVVVIQRPVRWVWAAAVPHLQEAGVRVVVDVDDNFQHLHEANIAKAFFDKSRAHIVGSNFVADACRTADLVTCTTPALAEKYGFGHAAILPNLVPERYLQAFGYGPQTIGWSGAVGTHPEDLEQTGGAVQTALDASGWSFWAVGTGQRVKECLELSEEPRASGFVEFWEYILQVARMRIGIVPLKDSVFNAAKSSLKMMEMAATGAAVVASPSPDNVRLNKLGVGILAATPQKWRKHLLALVRNEEYRLDVAERGHEVVKGLTYEAHCGRWWDAWQKAVDQGPSQRILVERRLDRLMELR